MQEYKLKLEEEKKLLEDELKSLGELDPETGDWEATPDKEIIAQDVQDEADMAGRTQEYGEKVSTLNTLEKRLADINTALGKIEGGNYGTCEICGVKIEEERLAVNPSARTCERDMEKVI